MRVITPGCDHAHRNEGVFLAKICTLRTLAGNRSRFDTLGRPGFKRGKKLPDKSAVIPITEMVWFVLVNWAHLGSVGCLPTEDRDEEVRSD
jgi:hypothetical protein